MGEYAVHQKSSLAFNVNSKISNFEDEQHHTKHFVSECTRSSAASPRYLYLQTKFSVEATALTAGWYLA